MYSIHRKPKCIGFFKSNTNILLICPMIISYRVFFWFNPWYYFWNWFLQVCLSLLVLIMGYFSGTDACSCLQLDPQSLYCNSAFGKSFSQFGLIIESILLVSFQRLCWLMFSYVTMCIFFLFATAVIGKVTEKSFEEHTIVYDVEVTRVYKGVGIYYTCYI